MGSFASVNGVVTPAGEARISVLDNGFTFGDSVYETVRTYGGRPFHLDRHLQRLRASAARLGIEVAVADAELERRVAELLERAANRESYIRLIVSRGVGEISYRFDRVQGPTVVMVAKPYEPFPETFYSQGAPVVVSSIRRNHRDALDPAIKSCNLLNNILAVRDAQARGAFEAILLNLDGEVAEGASSNLFVASGGRITTPPLEAGILAGITRAVVLEVAREVGVPVSEGTVRVADLSGADEAFITSTLKELMPIRTVDGRPLAVAPGPLTSRLLEAFRAYARRH